MTRIDTYVACAMTAMPEEEYTAFRHSVLATCDALAEHGFSPYREPYEMGVESIDTPGEAIALNKPILDGAERFVLIYTHKEGSSSLIELGYAWARGIPIFIFAKRGVKVPYYLRDAEAAREYGIYIHTFDDEREIAGMVRDIHF